MRLSIPEEARLSIDYKDVTYKMQRSPWMLLGVDVGAPLDVCLAQIKLEIHAAYLDH